MSPRHKSDKSKHHRFELRLNDEMDNMLNECSQKLEISKTEVINRGIRMVKLELEKNKTVCTDQSTDCFIFCNLLKEDCCTYYNFFWYGCQTLKGDLKSEKQCRF